MNSANVPRIPPSQGPLGKEWVICKWHAQYGGEVSHKPSVKRALPPHAGPLNGPFLLPLKVYEVEQANCKGN